jgi:MFS transporter, FHS family, glucose/mannose:H+ symporter
MSVQIASNIPPAPGAPADEPPYSNNLVFLAACLGMLLFGIVFLSLGAVNNMLAERFALDDNAIGTLTALLPLGILVGSLVFGPVVDRFGYRWMLVGAALLVVVALEGMALAPTLSFVQLIVFLIGVGGGVLNGATNALAADVSAGTRGARLSLLGVFFGIGALTMPGTLALLSRHYSLSAIVAGVGAVTIVPAVYCLAIRFPPPKQRAERFSAARVFGLLRDPIFLLAGLTLAIQSGMEGMSNDWMTRYFKKVTLAEQAGPAEWKTQLGLVAVTGAMVLTRLALAAVLKRVSSRVVLLASVGVTALGAMLLMSAGGYGVSLLAAVLIGAGLAAGFPVVLSYIGDRYPRQSGTAFSTVFVIALAGNMAINKTFGYVAQIHGVQQYAKVMLICLACSAVLLLLVMRQLGRHTSADPNL